MKLLFALAFTALLMPQALAVNFKEAPELLVYFEHGEQSAEYCAQRGYPSQAIYRQWLSRYAHLKTASEQAILAEMNRRGLTKEEQGYVLAESLAHQRNQVQKSVALGGDFMCRNYRKYMDGLRPGPTP